MNKNKSLTLTMVLALLVSAPACNSGKDKQAAEQAVITFHARLNATQFHDIYSESSSEFQKSGSEAELNQFFSAIHRKLGDVKRADEQRFFINFSTSGTFVTMTYSTQFANGPGTEQFVWKVGEKPALVNYKVDSRALVVN